MDYRFGKMKKVKKKVKIVLRDLAEGIKDLIIATGIVFIILIYLIIFLLLEEVPKLQSFAKILENSFSLLLGLIFGIYLENIKSRMKVRELKSAIISELRYILISLIENFTRFYGIYFVVIRLLEFDLKWLRELTEKYRKYFPDYLMNEIKVCMSVYENLEKLTQEDIEKNIKIEFLKEYIKEMRLRSQCLTMEGVQHYFEKEKSKYEESKSSIKPIYMALLSSILSSAIDKLSASDKDFTENILSIWYEINELNKEIEVLKESSQMNPELISSILGRIERIAIKIDEILDP
jgi:FtsZ-binding cell division protein ZapB